MKYIIVAFRMAKYELRTMRINRAWRKQGWLDELGLTTPSWPPFIVRYRQWVEAHDKAKRIRAEWIEEEE